MKTRLTQCTKIISLTQKCNTYRSLLLPNLAAAREGVAVPAADRLGIRRGAAAAGVPAPRRAAALRAHRHARRRRGRGEGRRRRRARLARRRGLDGREAERGADLVVARRLRADEAAKLRAQAAEEVLVAGRRRLVGADGGDALDGRGEGRGGGPLGRDAAFDVARARIAAAALGALAVRVLLAPPLAARRSAVRLLDISAHAVRVGAAAN